jgi:hypothetical protein
MVPMHERIRNDLLLNERALWTALTSADPGPAVKELCSPDCNLLFSKTPILGFESDPSIDEALRPPFHHFDSYSFKNVSTIVIDLMAGSVTYEVNAYRGNRQYNILGSTTWGQGSDGEWKIICHQESPA